MSPAWFKDKEKRSRNDLLNLFGAFVFRGYGLGYTALYLLDVSVYKVNDAIVVLGALVLQATTLDDLHRFKRYLNGLYPLALNASR